jgi:hypothetical protein
MGPKATALRAARPSLTSRLGPHEKRDKATALRAARPSLTSRLGPHEKRDKATALRAPPEAGKLLGQVLAMRREGSYEKRI